jgi:Kef-type K+ transport system membrane component KefB
MSDELTSALVSLFVVALVAALAPFIVALVPRLRVPQVVVLIVGGIIIGPQVMHLAEPKSIELLRPPNVGLGFIFLLAGYELELALFRQRPGKLAIVAWVASAVIAGVVVGLLAVMGLVRAFVPVALVLTTTAAGISTPALTLPGRRKLASCALCGSKQTRTADPFLVREVLYQLSYAPGSLPRVRSRQD